ncbi:hypothetical protein N2152v2_003554 [Parachlorella kessleri]
MASLPVIAGLATMVSRLLFDTLSALTLAITALLGAYTPVFLAKQDRNRGGSGRSLTFILGNLFSAGVMVSAGFCHLLGESLRQMPVTGRFPLPTFLCGLGFMLTLVADAVASRASGGHGHGHGDGGCHTGGPLGTAVDPEKALLPGPVPGCKRLHKTSVSQEEEEEERLIPNGRYSSDVPVDGGFSNPAAAVAAAGSESDREEGVALCVLSSHQHHLSEGQLVRHNHHQNHSGGGSSGRYSPFRLEDGEPPDIRLGLADAVGEGRGSPLRRQRQQQRQHSLEMSEAGSLRDLLPPERSSNGGAAPAGQRPLLLPPQRLVRGGSSRLATPTAAAAAAAAANGAANGREAPALLQAAAASSSVRSARAPKSAVSFITAVLMGVALCFHSLLEGAAMGAQETLTNSLHIFIAIVSHKGLAAYALGSSIVDSQVSMQQFWSVVLPFTFASPVGIFIGYIISDLATGAGAAGISALASGTFLYVAFMEVIPKELYDHSHLAAKMAMLLLGFGAMSLLAVWA